MLDRTNGCRSTRTALAGALATGLALLTTQALAQDHTVGVGAQTAVPPAAAPAPAPAAAPAPAPPPPVAAPVPGGDDHDMWVGHFGATWFGTQNILVGPAETLVTPAVGIRYWLTPMIGIDAGLGFNILGGSTTTVAPGMGGASTSTSTDDPSRTTFLLHGGVPIALGGGRHVSFQVTPELNLGFGSGTNKAPPGAAMGTPDTSLSGFLFQLGARAGAEVYFGFIGIPQLALQGSVGLYFQTQSGKTETGAVSQKHSVTQLATSDIQEPWQLFTKNIAATYYF